MADDKTKTGGQDRARVAANQTYEVRDFAERFALSPAQAAEKVTNFGKNTPLGRPGQPAELAATFVPLACQDSSYTTGALYEITGGRPMI